MVKKGFLLKSMIIPIISLSLISTSAYASKNEKVPDEFGQNIGYLSHYEHLGCSPVAWKSLVNNYQTQMETYKQINKPLNEAMYKSIVDVGAINSDCANKIINTIEDIKETASKISSAMQAADAGKMPSITKIAMDQAVKSAQKAALSQLEQICVNLVGEIDEKLGINKYLSITNEIVNNPFEYGIKKSGLDKAISNKINKLDISAQVGQDFSGTFKNEVSKIYSDTRNNISNQVGNAMRGNK